MAKYRVKATVEFVVPAKSFNGAENTVIEYLDDKLDMNDGFVSRLVMSIHLRYPEAEGSRVEKNRCFDPKREGIVVGAEG